MNRRSFFTRVGQAVACAVIAPYMALAPLRPRVREVMELNDILKHYYLAATRDLLNSKRILSNLVKLPPGKPVNSEFRQFGSFEHEGRKVTFSLNFRDTTPREHRWSRMYDQDAYICGQCGRTRSGYVESQAPLKDREIKESTCYPEDRVENLKKLAAEKSKWIGAAHYVNPGPLLDHETHVAAHAEFLRRVGR